LVLDTKKYLILKEDSGHEFHGSSFERKEKYGLKVGKYLSYRNGERAVIVLFPTTCKILIWEYKRF
jgi:hypothetical protein